MQTNLCCRDKPVLHRQTFARETNLCYGDNVCCRDKPATETICAAEAEMLHRVTEAMLINVTFKAFAVELCYSFVLSALPKEGATLNNYQTLEIN